MTEFLHPSTPLLSFCIPTYNRVGSVLPLVRRVLESPTHEIEVVVADNASTDDTLAQLAAINDSRLVVIRNETNRGALFNQVNVLLQGRGTYSVLLLDKDSVDPAVLPSFLDFLQRESPASGYCKYHRPIGSPAQVFGQIDRAFREAAYSGHHPSGYFFRRVNLHEIDALERFTDFERVGNFPFEFMQAELFLCGPAAIFHEPVFIPESLEAAQAFKSFTINAARDDAFFSPKGRLKMTVNFTRHIGGLPIPARIKRGLITDLVINGLFECTVGYRNVLRNEAICVHYHIGIRRIGTSELLSHGRMFLRSFFEAFPRGTVAPGVRVSRSKVMIEVAARLTRALKRRLKALVA